MITHIEVTRQTGFSHVRVMVIDVGSSYQHDQNDV